MAPRIAFIQQTVTAVFGLRPVDMVSRRRDQLVVLPRQIAMYLAREMTAASFQKIGREFGGKHHTTVMHAVKVVQALIDSAPAFAGTVDDLRKGLAT